MLDAAVAAALDRLRSEIAILRSLSFELRPAVLDELGTESALAALAELAERGGIAVELDVDLAYERGRQPVRHTAELETAIYRIVQEALDNIHRHAQAAHATVTVSETNDTVELSIQDDGRGFAPADVAEGFGLAGLRDWIKLLDGTFRIESAPGKGTTIRAALPARRRRTTDDQRSADQPPRPPSG